MFLNDVGQAVAVNSSSGVTDNLDEYPLLLHTSEDFSRVKVPLKWRGCLITSSDIMEAIEKRCPKMRELKLSSHLQDGILALPGGNQVDVARVPVTEDKQSILILCKDKYVTTMHVKLHSLDTRFLVSNAVFRAAVEAGIDVMYIDDSILLNSNRNNSFELQLWELVFLVRPKHIVTIHGSELPVHITELCRTATSSSSRLE